MSNRYQVTLIFNRKVRGYCLTYIEGYEASDLGAALRYAARKARLKKFGGHVAMYFVHDNEVGGLAQAVQLHV